MIIGIDTGGTFTDVACFDGQVLTTYKLPSTPNDFAEAVLAGVEAVRPITAGPFELVHSTTVATNALLERKGAKTALITTKGFQDVLEIGRQNRAELYNFKVERPQPLVPRALRYEVPERIGADGGVVEQLDVDAVEKLVARLQKQGVESLAVCLLFSFLYPAHERKIKALARRLSIPISISSEVLPEFREFERCSTTVANAYVSPVMKDYLDRLQLKAKKMGAERLRIVQQNGGCMSTRSAGNHAVSALLSGPAAGVIGALHIARQAYGREDVRLITFDMGGTSTDVALLDGDYQVTTESRIGGLPIGVPMMDIHTVGAGGGSLAYPDFGGGLHVGPESAGADPGPACYGKGDQPAVTDANLFLGRLQAEHFLDGRFEPDVKRSRDAIAALAKTLGISAQKTAEGMIRLVNAHMEQAIRVISVERGYDPREFTLVSFGGAGGLHACAVADALQIPRVLIPIHAGVISAIGSVCADQIKDYSRTVMLPVNAKAMPRMQKALQDLAAQAEKELLTDGVAVKDITVQLLVDVRYCGQSFELPIEWSEDRAELGRRFHAAHQQRYGHADQEAAIEVVTVRVRGVGATVKPSFQPIARGRQTARAKINEGVYDRRQLKAGNRIAGPAVIVEDYSTTLLDEGWESVVDRWGNLLLERKGA